MSVGNDFYFFIFLFFYFFNVSAFEYSGIVMDVFASKFGFFLSKICDAELSSLDHVLRHLSWFSYSVGPLLLWKDSVFASFFCVRGLVSIF